MGSRVILGDIMVTVKEKIINEFVGLDDDSIITLITDTDSYYSTILSTIDYMINNRKMGGIYITSTRPASTIMEQLNSLEIDFEDLFFVDCISYLVGGTGKLDRTSFVESPTMMESIMLKADWLLKGVQNERKFIFFDSINTLSIYNEHKILSEFIHIFTNSLRMKEVFLILLSVKEQTPKELDSLLKITCDETIEIRGD